MGRNAQGWDAGDRKEGRRGESAQRDTQSKHGVPVLATPLGCKRRGEEEEEQ